MDVNSDNVYAQLFMLERKIENIKLGFMTKAISYVEAKESIKKLSVKHKELVNKLPDDERERYILDKETRSLDLFS